MQVELAFTSGDDAALFMFYIVSIFFAALEWSVVKLPEI